jgi:YVTN family beta-propeller protein
MDPSASSTRVLFSNACDFFFMTRRDWLTLSAALVSSACARAKRTGYAGYALIATSGENSLAVVDLTNFRPLKNIPLGAPPTAVIPAATSGQSYVLTPSSDSVHIIDRNLSLTSSHRLGDGIVEIRLFPDASALVAIGRGSRELIQADPVSLRVTRRFKLESEPFSLDVSQTGHAAISYGSHGTVELIHLASGKRVRIPVGGVVGAVRFRGDGQVLLITRLDERSILGVDVATQQVVAELPLAMQPDNLCFNADQGQLFVSGQGMDGIAIVFPYNTMEVEQTVLAGRNPGIMAASGAPAYLFVASANGSNVCILNVDTRKVIGAVDVGGQPEFIAITPDNRFALVLNKNSGDMAVIHIPAIRTNRAKNGAALFTLLGVGAKPVHAAIVPRMS